MYSLRRIVHQEDIQALAPEVRRKVTLALAQLRLDPFLGDQIDPPKEYQVVKRHLTDCRRIWVSLPDRQDMLVIYRVHRYDESIEVVAIGHRQASEAYRMAALRLAHEDEMQHPAKETPRWAKMQVQRKRKKME